MSISSLKIFNGTRQLFLYGLAITWVGILNFSLHRIDPAVKNSEETAGIPYPTKLFQIFSLGNQSAVADWFLMSALADPSLVHLPTGQHSNFYYKLLLVTELDPGYKDIYDVAGMLLAVARKDGLGARDILKKGVAFNHDLVPTYPAPIVAKYWNHTWSLLVLLGYVELFELNNLPAAAEAFRQGAEIPGAPLYLSGLRQKLTAVGGLYDVGISLLDFMTRSHAEPEFIAKVREDIQNLRIGRWLFHLNYRYTEFARREKKHRPELDDPTLVDRFVRQTLGSDRDPWGGLLRWDSAAAKIVSGTPYSAVLGLE